MSAAPLYVLERDLEEIESVLDDRSKTDAEKEIAVAAWLASMENITKKLDGYCALIRTLESEAAACENEAKEFDERSKRAEKNAARLKGLLLAFFDARGVDRWQTRRFRPHVVGSGGKQPVVIVDEAVVPSRFKKKKVEIVIDKTAIHDALQAKQKVRGCTLGQRGRRLDLG